MSSGEALVETGSAPVKASCLSFKLKLLIGLAVGTVVVSGAVTAGVLLSNNTNKSVDAVMNSTTADYTANGTQTSLVTTVDSLTNEYETTETQTANTPTNNQTPASETNITTVRQDSSSTVTADPLNNETLSQMTTNSNTYIEDTTNSSSLMSSYTTASVGTTISVLGGTQSTATRFGTAPITPAGATQTVTAAGAIQTTTAAGATQTMATINAVTFSTTTPSTTAAPTTQPTTELWTPSPCSASRSRTVIFMFYDGSGDVYLRGIPVAIDHLSLGPGFNTYNMAAATNTQLSWGHNSPTAKTSNDVSSSIYYSLNTYGDNYWIMDVCMECPASGWFEIKGFTSDWERDRNQDGICSGSAGANKIASSSNHQGMCGKINVFKLNQNMCTIDNF